MLKQFNICTCNGRKFGSGASWQEIIARPSKSLNDSVCLRAGLKTLVGCSQLADTGGLYADCLRQTVRPHHTLKPTMPSSSRIQSKVNKLAASIFHCLANRVWRCVCLFDNSSGLWSIGASHCLSMMRSAWSGAAWPLPSLVFCCPLLSTPASLRQPCLL